MNRDNFQYGVLLPHFGPHATPERLVEGAKTIEKYRFDSIWVRDHLVFHPHEHEDQNKTHVDPFVVLSALASATDRVTFGTATLIPHRHPILAALMLGSLDWLSGGGRVIAGWGIGTYQHEFDAIGIGSWDRRRLIEEQINIVRQLWRGQPTSFHGEFYDFDDVEIHPVPSESRPIPIWYGGNSLASVRRAVEYCDGWIPARMPITDFTKRLLRMQRFSEDANKALPTTGIIPYVVPARTVEEGIAYLNLPALIDEVTRMCDPRAAGFRTLSDLEGAAIAGPPDVLVEEIRRYQDAGVQHYVFDFRARYSDFEECLAIIGEEVLPVLHRGDGRGLV